VESLYPRLLRPDKIDNKGVIEDKKGKKAEEEEV
jgi:hypothetical protein